MKDINKKQLENYSNELNNIVTNLNKEENNIKINKDGIRLANLHIQSYARNMKNTNDIAFTIAKSDMVKFDALKEKINEIVKASNIFIDEDIVKVSSQNWNQMIQRQPHT